MGAEVRMRGIKNSGDRDKKARDTQGDRERREGEIESKRDGEEKRQRHEERRNRDLKTE